MSGWRALPSAGRAGATISPPSSPAAADPGMRSAGAANGTFGLAAALREGDAAGAEAAAACGATGHPRRAGHGCRRGLGDHAAVARRGRRQGLRRLPERRHGLRYRARQRGRLRLGRAPEALHHARHGDRPGQDRRTSTGWRSWPRCAAQSIPETGTTIFRPPYTPVAIGALAGHHRGQHFQPPACRRPTTGPRSRAPPSSTTGLGCARSGFPGPARRTGSSRSTREVRAVRSSVGSATSRPSARSRCMGPDAGDLPRPGLHQHLLHPPRRAGPLRHHAARGRHGHGRRDDLPARRGPLLRHHHHRQGGTGHAAPGVLPPGAVAPSSTCSWPR